MATVVVDFLAHEDDEVIQFFGDLTTGYYGQTFVAAGPALTQIEIDPVGPISGTTDYNVLVATVTTDAQADFHPDQVLFASDPLTFTNDNVAAFEHITVPVTGLSLNAGQTYVFLLNANFGGNEGGADARVAATGLQTLPGYEQGSAVIFVGNTGSTATDFASDGWFNVENGGDLAFRLTFDDKPLGIVFNGTNKSDTKTGTAGDDELHGGNAGDVLDGAGGNDKVFGDNGDDTLFGGLGDDLLDGGNGADVLNGGFGNNTLTGGNGRDTFDADTSATGTNTVTDFAVRQDHFRLLDGVTVLAQTDTAAGLDLTLSTGGHMIFLGVHVADWHVLA